MRTITLENVRVELEAGGVIQKERLYHPTNKWRRYKLLKSVRVKLSNGRIITIPEGFEWDLSSVPRLLWPILPPDGDHEIAALIHDYLYRVRLFSEEMGNFKARKFADYEMYLWSVIANPGKKLDNLMRYRGVRLFGGRTYNKDN